MEKIHAFDVALAKSRQGLTDEQLLTRRRDAKRLLAACMPSLYSCHDLVVVEGLKAEGETLWMKVDIAISPQLTLNLDGKLRTPNAESTAFMRLAKELAELKRQAIEFSIRLGEIARCCRRRKTAQFWRRQMAAEFGGDVDGKEATKAPLFCWEEDDQNGGSVIST